MYIFVIIGVVILIAVITTVKEAAKASKQTKTKQEAEKAMKILDDKDEFKKFLDYDNSSKSTSVSQPVRTAPQQRPQVQVREQVQPSVKVHTPATIQPSGEAQQRRQMTDELQQRLAQLKRKQEERLHAKNAEVTTTPHVDAHCDGNHPEYGDKYRVEYVPTMHSIGGKSTEGCEDHYHLRYVKLDEAEANKGLQLTALQKAVVYGEVINSPAFKRGRSGRLR